MKLQPLAMVVSLLSPTTAAAAYCSRCHRPTLSATAKKPASMAGLLYLPLNIARPSAFFLPAPPASQQPCALKSITQTPSNL
jgi:hypothetical protein